MVLVTLITFDIFNFLLQMITTVGPNLECSIHVDYKYVYMLAPQQI